MQYLTDQARVFSARAAAHGLDLNLVVATPRPRAMFISCSDARIVPSLLTGSQPGDLFELRTYGGIVPRYDPERSSGESRTIEYAVDQLEITDIVVCGHSHCDAANSALLKESTSCEADSESAESPVAADDLIAIGHWHTLTQLDVLSDYPCVAPRLAERTLRLHAWFHELATGSTTRYQPRASVFLLL